MPLLKSQKNAVFEVVRATELEPQHFKWSERASLPQIVEGMGQADLLLTHEPSGDWFLFQEESTWRYEYSPGLERTSESGAANEWESMLMHVKIWLVAVKRELSEPDLWAELQAGREFIGEIGESVGNDPFTPSELERVRSQLREARESITTVHEL